MAISKPHKPRLYWNQKGYRRIMFARAHRHDKTQLEEIFKLADDVPLLKEALEWAELHGIKFFIDRKVQGVTGYYSTGGGVLGLSEKTAQNPAEAVRTLVHEIRHAWQDFNGLHVKSKAGFMKVFLSSTLIEADGMAFGLRAADQFQAAQLRKRGEPVPAELQASLANEGADLGEKFLRSFASTPWTTAYGENISKDYAQRKGIIQVDKSKPNGGLLAGGFEFKVGYNPIIGDLDAGDMDSVLRLGVNFSGTVNYLAQLQPDILPRQILSPSLANTFWGSANPEQKKLTTEIRKVNLREKLAPENKRKLHPWP